MSCILKFIKVYGLLRIPRPFCNGLKSVNPDVEFIIENPYPSIMGEIDFPRIAQVITNFTTNAIKNTQKGEIRVGYTYDFDKEIFEVYVKDTGCGIPDDKKHFVFDRFQKLDQFAQGTGLGFAIVKSLISQFEGVTCGFESTEGVGSYFWARGLLR